MKGGLPKANLLENRLSETRHFDSEKILNSLQINGAGESAKIRNNSEERVVISWQDMSFLMTDSFAIKEMNERMKLSQIMLFVLQILFRYQKGILNLFTKNLDEADIRILLYSKGKGTMAMADLVKQIEKEGWITCHSDAYKKVQELIKAKHLITEELIKSDKKKRGRPKIFLRIDNKIEPFVSFFDYSHFFLEDIGIVFEPQQEISIRECIPLDFRTDHIKKGYFKGAVAPTQPRIDLIGVERIKEMNNVNTLREFVLRIPFYLNK